MDPLVAKALIDTVDVDPFGRRPRRPRRRRSPAARPRQVMARALRRWADRVEPVRHHRPVADHGQG